MTSTPCNHIVLAAAVALGIVAVSCGADTRADIGVTNPVPPTSVPGYSYDHDSRINETPSTMGYSYDHDSHHD